MNSPAIYPESQLDQEDVVYHCKGCEQILEEGKAFELAGNRWHIDCFRCNTCRLLLDSDANLLLLGDGSLICNNCTYSCAHCNNKIEDLAILTGDQAFCSNCFRCRNCKQKIPELKYARTTQGIFCMNCYESLTQRKKKNRNKNKASVNKALPPMPRKPQHAVDSPETTSLSETEKQSSRNHQAGQEVQPLVGLPATVEQHATLPSSTYSHTSAAPSHSTPQHLTSAPNPNNSNEHHLASSIYDPLNDLPDGLFVPLVLDRMPAPGTSPNPNAEEISQDKDYLLTHQPLQSKTSRELINEARSLNSRSPSMERKPISSPHIAYQDKRQQSDHIADIARKRGASTTASPRPDQIHLQNNSSYETPHVDFKLQDVPKPKKTVSRGESIESKSPTSDAASRSMTPQVDINSPDGSEAEVTKPDIAPPRPSPNPSNMPLVQRPRRGDSLGAHSISQKETSRPMAGLQHISEHNTHERTVSTSSIRNNQDLNGGMTISKPIESPNAAKSIYDTRSDANVPNAEAFVAPRHAPPPPMPTRAPNGIAHDWDATSPSQYSGEENHENVLRKMSNAVRGHNRSVSDRVVTSPQSPKRPWPKSPTNGDLITASPESKDSRDEYTNLRSQLYRAQQRVAELESEKTSLQGLVNGNPEIKEVNTALREKRSTIAILDTQREIVVRELEVLTEHLKQVKDSAKPFDLSVVKSETLSDFQSSLTKLKDNIHIEIEGLMQKRNELNDEITMLIKMKDKGFSEYEDLSNKNAQLAHQCNELYRNIQEMLKSGKKPDGLGVMIPGQVTKDHQLLAGSGDLRQLMLDSNSTLTPDGDQDSAVITTPHVVKLKQQKPNMLRKTGFGLKFKGLKGALLDRDPKQQTYPTEGVPYSAMDTKQVQENKKFGFFSNDRTGNKHLRTLQNNGSNPHLPEQPASQLFGTELSARCQFENKNIPAIVIRCVEQVELRGMDAEGIYRKSGGSGQVNTLKAGFEKDDDYDISDPELEIHAVTSCLKQYFRKLPVPLITFDVYDLVLDAAKYEDINQRVSALRQAVDKLPKAHRDCLEFLIFHLARVTAHERDNLMTALNVAVVFAPTIMRPSTIEREMSDMSSQRKALQSLLELNKAIFENSG